MTQELVVASTQGRRPQPAITPTAKPSDRTRYALQFAENDYLKMVRERWDDGASLGNMDLHVLKQMAHEMFLHHQKMEGYYMALSVAQEDRRHGQYGPMAQGLAEMEATLDPLLVPDAYRVVRTAYADEMDEAIHPTRPMLQAAE